MKKGALLLVVLSLLLSCLIGCSGQRDVEKAPQQHGESTIAVAQTPSEQEPSESAQPTEPMPAEENNDPEENGSTFPTLPEVIDDSDFRNENVGPDLSWAEISFEWLDYFGGMEPPARDVTKMTDEEQKQWQEEYGTFCHVTNAKGEQLEIGVLGPDAFGRTTMPVLGESGNYMTLTYAVPYDADFTFAINRDNRPLHYKVFWPYAYGNNVKHYYISVKGDHLGDVRITTAGVNFSGRAKNYETTTPQNFTVSVTIFLENETGASLPNTPRFFSISGAEATDFLLTREGDRYVVLCSHDCTVKITDDLKTILTETVPAGTRWYVEDLTAPENELKTGLLP